MKNLDIGICGTMGLPPNYGGAETSTYEISKRLVEQGHKVTVYSSLRNNKNKINFYNGIRIVYVPTVNKNKYLDFPLRGIATAIRASIAKHDVLHFWGPDSWLYMIITKFFKQKAVLTLDGLEWEKSSFPKLVKLVLKLTSKLPIYLADEIVIDSKIAIIEYRKLLNRNFRYIPYGSSVSLGSYSLTDPVLNKFNLKSKQYIIFIGRFTQEKNIHFLIRAYNNSSNLRKKYPLVIVGSDIYKTGYEEFLRKLACKEVIFTGQVFGKGYQELLQNSLAYVTASNIEGTSPSLLAAMGFEICPIVSNIPFNLETVGKSGISFDPNSSAVLTNIFDDIGKDQFDLIELGRIAKIKVEKEYNWDTISSKYLQAYRAAIDNQ